MLDHRAGGGEHHLHLTAHQITHRRCAALVTDAHQLHAGHVIEQFRRQIIRRTDRPRGVVESARFRLGQRDQFTHAARRYRWMNHQQVGRARGEHNGGELRHIVGQLFEQRCGPDGVVMQEQCVAVGVGAGHVLRRDGRCATAVFDNEGLPEQRGVALSEHACGEVNAATRRCGDDAHGFGRIVLRLRGDRAEHDGCRCGEPLRESDC